MHGVQVHHLNVLQDFNWLQVVGQTTESIGWSITKDAINGWHSGNITLQATDVVARTRGCQNRFSIVMRGAGVGKSSAVRLPLLLRSYPAKRTKLSSALLQAPCCNIV